MPTWAIWLTILGSIFTLIFITWLTVFGLAIITGGVREDRSAWGILVLFLALNIIGLIIGIIIMQKKYNELLIDLGIKKGRHILYDYEERRKIKNEMELKEKYKTSQQSNKKVTS